MKTAAAAYENQEYCMENLLGNRPVHMGCGTVCGGDGDQFMLQDESGLFSAGQAFSCLVRPEPGDRVLFAREAGRQCHILAILERDVSPDATLRFRGNVCLEAKEGRVGVVAREGIDLASAADIDLVSPRLGVTALEGDISMDSASVTGNALTTRIRRIRVFADTLDTVADRLSHRVRNWFRFIEELDQLQAGQLIHLIRKTLSMRSHHAVITAKEDVKIDGERIHMG